MPDPVAKQLAELEIAPKEDLRGRWEQVFKRAAPTRISRDLLTRVLAYHVQAQAEGGLSKAALKRLGPRPNSTQGTSRPPASTRPHLKPGIRLVREWRGEVHRVTVLDDGFEYRGRRYTSLSRIAREITGTRWSGPAFFGLRKAGRVEEPMDGG